MHVLIPAGGRGQRLRPLTDYTPKPLLPIGGRPILTQIVEAVPRSIPVTVIVAGELEPHFSRWKRELPSAARVRIYSEPATEAGASGPVVAIDECIRELGLRDDLLVLMGDSLLPFSLSDVLPKCEEDPLICAYRLHDLQEARRFGVVELGSNDVVLSFEEKPQSPRSSCVFTGCFYAPARLLPKLHVIASERPQQMGHLVAGLVESGERVNVHLTGGEWHDIGTFNGFLEAHRHLITPGDRAVLEEARNLVEGVVYVHPDAGVSDSHLKDCIVYPGAHVTGARLDRCVIHSGVHVAGRSVVGSLLTQDGEQAFCD